MDTSALVQQINDATATCGSANESDKAQIIEACNNLISSLEPVEKKLMDLLFSPVKAVALRLGIDMHLFDSGANALERGENITLGQLSSETNCEALLIKRIMRVLVELKTFSEVDQDVFQPQAIVSMYKTESPIAQAIIHFTSHLMQMFKLPDYFEERGYRCPDDAFDSPFQYAMGTSLHVFDWLAAHPKQQHAFNVTMTMRTQRGLDSKWFEVFPVDNLVGQKSSSDTFLVDIGGSVGHNSISLKEQYPNVPGKLIVQDIAAVIDSIKDPPPGIEVMAHDFFTPQPIRLAKVYFVAHILHDWPDKQAKIILGNIRDAMGPDSVLLLSETVMPERDVPFIPAVVDLTMMAAFSSLERTENQFRELLDSVGLELVKVWSAAGTAVNQLSLASSVVEARLRHAT